MACCHTVGVPLIAQVVVFKLRPVGRVGLELQLVTVPVMVGVTVVIVVPIKNAKGLPE